MMRKAFLPTFSCVSPSLHEPFDDLKVQIRINVALPLFGHHINHGIRVKNGVTVDQSLAEPKIDGSVQVVTDRRALAAHHGTFRLFYLSARSHPDSFSPYQNGRSVGRASRYHV